MFNDPWGHYEENPDHYVTAQAVEALAGCPPIISMIFHRTRPVRWSKHGLEYVEEFHYIGPDHSLDEYIRAHAERI